jgi:hypothetical protein
MNRKKQKTIKVSAPSYFAGGPLDIAMAAGQQMARYGQQLEQIINPEVDPTKGDYKFN